MDIRLAQRIALDTKRAKSFDTTDIPLEFSLLSAEVTRAFDAWSKGRWEISEELAAIAIVLLRLAEMVGAELQEVVEAKLAVGRATVYGKQPNGVPAKDTSGAAKSAINHGKLVRDKIPQIIQSKGEQPVIQTADSEEYNVRLRDKLREEVEEYLASDDDREELADILEVLYALARRTGTDEQQLEKLRAAKAKKRGGFADRIIWFGNQPAVAAQSETAAMASTAPQMQPRRRTPATGG
jgi:predicted house-cleaning noncanonical NTP pyrophosphatase (MazG superfamily)